MYNKDHSKRTGIYSHMMTDNYFVCDVTFTTKFFISYIPFRDIAGFFANTFKVENSETIING